MAAEAKQENTEWDVSTKDNDYIELKKRYYVECPVMKHKESQESMFKVLTVGKRLQIPLLLYLIDCYTRTRIDIYKTKKETLSIDKWVKTSSIIKSLIDEDKIKQELIKSAMDTFYKRFNHFIQFKPMEKINDYLEAFTRYFDDTLHFVKSFMKTESANPPYQIDLLIIPQKINSLNDTESSISSIDLNGQEIGFDDEEQDDEEQDDDNFNISACLQNCTFVSHTRKENDDKIIRKLYSKLTEKDNVDETLTNKRLCIIVDRRKAEIENNDDDDEKRNDNDVQNNQDRQHMIHQSQIGDKCYMYFPPKSNQIANNHLPEKFIQLSCDYVLSNKINAKSGSSQFFMLSFHVEQKDEIRCYLYQRSQISRFFVQDIKDVWTHLFENNGANAAFISKNGGVEQFLNLDIPDRKFGSFCKRK